MQLRYQASFQVAGSLAAFTAIAAIIVVVFVIGTNRGAPPATAIGPTPTAIANDGSLGGVVDLLIHAPGDESFGLFTCIGKVDHEAGSNLVTTAAQCYVDIPGLESAQAPPSWADIVCTVCPNPDLQNPSEPGPDLVAGPPPPPPYNNRPPDKAFGAFYPGGQADCVNNIAGWGANDPCLIQTFCFEDLGVIVGPNIIARAYIGDPQDAGGFAAPNDTGGDGKSHGAVDVFYNQSNSSCKAGTPKGSPNLDNYDVISWDVYDKAGTTNAAAPWRLANLNGSSDPARDYDGDGCWDGDELDAAYVAPGSGVKCGDDPFNPTDSFDAATVDLTGIYSVDSRLLRADCTDPQNCVNTQVGGIYTTCLAELLHDTGTNGLVMRPYCYADQPAIQINPEAYPGVAGDGFPGAPPPGPNVGNNIYAYGDVDMKHAELAGTFDPIGNNISVAGCFIDEDGLGGVGDVWFVIDVSAHQRPGTATIYLNQAAGCAGPPTGAPIESTVSFVKHGKGLARDDDQDGMPTSLELQDDSVCGRRDPFNKNDYYDVGGSGTVARDGVIDLFNDIVGVINNYEPDGYTQGATAISGAGLMVNYDRPPRLTGSGGSWNRGSPDGVIDLFNDISGVIAQYNPDGVNSAGCG